MTDEHKKKLADARKRAKADKEKMYQPESQATDQAKLEPVDKSVDTVEIKKSDYDKLMAQLERNAKDIELLYKASDKHRMAKAIGDGGEILVRKAKVWTWDNTGNIVVATNLISNRSEIILGKWFEDQQVVVVFEDGSTVTVPYLEFSRKILNKIPADIISTSKSHDDNNREVVIYKLQFPNGKILEINSAFVN